MSRASAAPATAEPIGLAVEVLVRFAKVGHDAGYPTADLEERMAAIADALGLEEAQVSSTPTLVDVSLGAVPFQRSFTLRVRPTAVDLDAIARLDDLAQDIIAGQIDPGEALTRLGEVELRPLVRAWPVRLGAYALAGASVAPVLGGGWRDVLASGIVGLLVGAIALAARKAAVRAEPMLAPFAAVAASFTAALIAEIGVNASPDTVTLAALVTFLPGMALTIGMRELATEHLQSGVANTANALVQLLGLVFGVGVGRSIASSWFGIPHQHVTHPSFSGLYVLAAAAAGLAFTVTLRAPLRSAPVMCSAAILAILVNAGAKDLLGAPAGVFVSALSLGVVGGVLSVPLRRSPLVFIVPGILMLVPGSAGFNSLLQLLAGQTVSGIEAGFNTFVTAMAIAYGLMVSAVILPRRFTQFAPRPRTASDEA
jgi:uncharacterized membrane protein YjjP (DUF1212 family)